MKPRINFTALVLFITFYTVVGQKCTDCDKNGNGISVKHRRSVTDSSDSQTPWQVCVNFRGDDPLIRQRCYCGGVLVSPKWVISSAHCFMSNNISSPRLKSQFQFVLGVSAGKQKQSFKAKNIIVHDGYRPSKQACVPGDNDIALIELDQTAKTDNNHVKVMKLPKDDAYVGGLPCSVAVWNGRTSGTDISNAAVSVPLDLGVCPTSTNERKSQILEGESGGGIVCGQQNKTLAGVVMTGRKCGRTGTFLVITEYLSWITNNTDLTS